MPAMCGANKMLCTWHLISSSLQPSEASTVILPILQMRKLKFSVFKWPP